MTERVWTDERVEELKYLFIEQKFGQAAISRILSDKYKIEISRNSVTGKLFRLGIPGVKAGITEEQQAARRLRRRDTYNDKRRQLRAAGRAERRPTLKIVSNGAGTGLRIIETVTGDLPSFACSEVVSLNIALTDLEDHHCRYITNNDISEPLFCGRPIVDGQNYSFCARHLALCIAPRAERKAA